MSESEMPTPRIVVFDTNALIPLILPASRSTHLLSRLNRAGWRLALSPQILAEVRDILLNRQPLRRWLKSTEEEIREFLQHLPTLARLVPGNELAIGAVPADPKDDMVVATAIESGASYIISEDHQLRDLGEYHGIKILSLDEFRAELDQLRVGMPGEEDTASR